MSGSAVNADILATASIVRLAGPSVPPNPHPGPARIAAEEATRRNFARPAEPQSLPRQSPGTARSAVAEASLKGTRIVLSAGARKGARKQSKPPYGTVLPATPAKRKDSPVLSAPIAAEQHPLPTPKIFRGFVLTAKRRQSLISVLNVVVVKSQNPKEVTKCIGKKTP